jgi:hypothetical protein
MATFIAFYDANVLYLAELRNFLMHPALTDIFRAKWSNAVHEEWISNALKNRPDLTRQKLERTRHLMDKVALDALVKGYEDLIPGLGLPDENDRRGKPITGGSLDVVYPSVRRPQGTCIACFRPALGTNAQKGSIFSLSLERSVCTKHPWNYHSMMSEAVRIFCLHTCGTGFDGLGWLERDASVPSS